ncbi:hypothetical protein BX600DRAFT_464573 [Xylariales sp. PMI_506]|nr:hypothetical protein BX600DRAFT_464573 [Xylariales sp. PMI_506]
MEAVIAATGLASAIITFIDFSTEIVKGASEIRRNKLGTSSENIQISSIIGDLEDLCTNLSVSDNKKCSISRHEVAIARLARECQVVCQQLIDRLQKVKTSAQISRYKALKVQWAILRQSGEISSIENRLAQFRAEITVRLLALFLEEQSSIKAQLDTVQHGAFYCQSIRADEIKHSREELVSTLERLKIHDDEQYDEKDDEAGAREDQEEVPPYTPESSTVLQPPLVNEFYQVKQRLDELQDAVRQTPYETRILQQLSFKDMHTREDDMEDASGSTFEWILDDDHGQLVGCGEGKAAADEAQSASEPGQSLTKQKADAKKRFLDWLVSEQTVDVFHITGKAGSGKSTMMKMLHTFPRTKELLRQWAGDKELLFAAFFFSELGTKMQRSLEGLYRSILVAVLGQKPGLIPILFPDQWRNMKSISEPDAHHIDMFRLPDIKRAINRLIEQTTNADCDFCLCLFIDGLDEFEGDDVDHWDLATCLQAWATGGNVKVCASSRPHTEFLDTFSEDTRIHLHEINGGDIEIYSRSMFENLSKHHVSKVREVLPALIRQIVYKSEGVFIWARFVVRSLVSEIRHHASVDTLVDRLDGFHSGLDYLYGRMLGMLDKENRQHSYLLILLVLHNPFKASLNALCVDWLDKLHFVGEPPMGRTYTPEFISECIARIRGQLDKHTKGLLEVYEVEQYGDAFGDFFRHRIRFFHRSVKEYLKAPKQRNLLTEATSGFNATRTYTLIHLAQVASIDEADMPSSIEWNCHVCEILRLDQSNASGGWEPPYRDRQEALRLLTSPRFIPQLDMFVYTPTSLICHDAPNNDSSFLHMAACYNQFDFICQELAAENPPDCLELERCYSDEGLLPRALREPSVRSLIMTAIIPSVPNLTVDFAALCKFLEDLFMRGISPRRHIALSGAEGDQGTKSASVWMIFCVDSVCTYYDELVQRANATIVQRFHLFSIFLKDETLEQPFFLVRSMTQQDEAIATHFITLEQLVRHCCSGASREPVLDAIHARWGPSTSTVPDSLIATWRNLGFEIVDRPKSLPIIQLQEFEVLFVATATEALSRSQLYFRLY